MDWQLTRNIIAYPRGWQTPVITEQYAYERICEAFPDLAEVTYIGFPWATVIDLLQTNQTEKAQPYLDILAQIPTNDSSVKITVAQHIYTARYIELFEHAGITDIFWSHATKDINQIKSVRIHPFPLYPIQCLNIAHNQLMPLRNRKYLYSFVGAYSPHIYISPARKWISELPLTANSFIRLTKEWHFQSAVYDTQIFNLDVAPDRQVAINKQAVEYIQLLSETVFSLCPSGSGPNSIRIWESIGFGCIPVIIADTLKLPGDLKEWQEAAIFISENETSIASLPHLLNDIAMDPYRLQSLVETGQTLWKKYGFDNFIYDIQQFINFYTDNGHITPTENTHRYLNTVTICPKIPKKSITFPETIIQNLKSILPFENITIATSIAPKNIDQQISALASWRHHGFKVLSINTATEIAILKPDFPEVTFVETSRDARETMGRALIFMDDVFAALKSSPSAVCGIINSDIHLRNDIAIYDFVSSEAKDAFICGHRYDVENLAKTPGKLYLNGYDLFFFDKTVLDRVPLSPFCLGATWWDMWLPLAMILTNVPSKRIIAPLGYHVLHVNRWDEQEWVSNCIRLVQSINSNQSDFSGHPELLASMKSLHDRQMPQGIYKLFRNFILEHTQIIAPEQMLPEGIDPALQSPSYLVSAIISTYNAEIFFSECLTNLFGQTLYEKGQLEIIIINSGSEQNEESIARYYMESFDHIVYQRTERETLYAAWNRGVKLARGKYITHANTDDRHKANAFERMAHILEQHDVGLVYVDALMTTTANENFTFNSAGKTWLLPDFNIRQALLDCPFGCQVMWRASVHEDVGMFDASYKRAGDYEFFLRVGLKAGAMHLPEVLALYHESPNNLSYQSPQEVIQEVNRFIGDYRRQLPLEIIYPYLKHDSSPLAKAAALVDFANNLMGISGFLFSDTQLAEALYRQAIEILPHDSDILGNLIVACIVNGNAFEAHSLVESVINPSPRLTYYKVLLAEGKAPELSLTHVEYPGLNSMQAVKTTSEIRVPWERPVMDSSVKTIIIDGVIFQLQHGRPFGISRMWLSLLTELGKGALASRIILLDRVGTAPKIPGIQTRRVPVFHTGESQAESVMLDTFCREENAELFLSTYYTYTTTTPSLLMLYDMIAERFEAVGTAAPNPAWRDKHHAIVNSSAFAVISQSTARDLVTFYPQAAQRSLTVIHCAVSDDFRVHSEAEIAAFKAVNGIDRPYFLLVGRRDPHKNVALFFQAFARLPDREQYAIFMAGGGKALEPELRELAGPATGYGGFFSDQDLSLAYSGAIALVYPSIYEGFGLPILEAMQSGCPVITCQNSSLPEVAGSAALYVGEGDYEEMARTLVSVQQPDVRNYLIKRGLERSRLFSWCKSEELLEAAILKTVAASGEMQISRGK